MTSQFAWALVTHAGIAFSLYHWVIGRTFCPLCLPMWLFSGLDCRLLVTSLISLLYCYALLHFSEGLQENWGKQERGRREKMQQSAENWCKCKQLWLFLSVTELSYFFVEALRLWECRLPLGWAVACNTRACSSVENVNSHFTLYHSEVACYLSLQIDEHRFKKSCKSIFNHMQIQCVP